MTETGLSAHDLRAFGLMLDSGRASLSLGLTYERPAYLYSHRLKGCTVGALSLIHI